jgi:dihydrofolate reductase
MTKVRVNAFSISLDGYGAGPQQSRETPLGVGGEELHEWIFPTKSWREKEGKEGTTGVDNNFLESAMHNLGAWIMGRNMFSPSRGDWPDDQWRGWWGKNPPYHCPVFVLTHHARPPIEMEGGTTFHFVTDGIHAALARAREAAGDKDIRIGGGASTIRQYLSARLIDSMHLAIAPRILGSGEPLLAGIDLGALGYELTRHVPSPAATHVVIEKRATGS